MYCMSNKEWRKCIRVAYCKRDWSWSCWWSGDQNWTTCEGDSSLCLRSPYTQRNAMVDQTQKSVKSKQFVASLLSLPWYQVGTTRIGSLICLRWIYYVRDLNLLGPAGLHLPIVASNLLIPQKDEFTIFLSCDYLCYPFGSFMVISIVWPNC